MFAHSLPVTLKLHEQLVLNYLKKYWNIVSWNEQGQMIYKDDAKKTNTKTNMIDLLTWMIKLKSNNTNQVLRFVRSLFPKATAKCYDPLEWIKNKDMLTMIKMVKDSDK